MILVISMLAMLAIPAFAACTVVTPSGDFINMAEDSRIVSNSVSKPSFYFDNKLIGNTFNIWYTAYDKTLGLTELNYSIKPGKHNITVKGSDSSGKACTVNKNLYFGYGVSTYSGSTATSFTGTASNYYWEDCIYQGGGCRLKGTYLVQNYADRLYCKNKDDIVIGGNSKTCKLGANILFNACVMDKQASIRCLQINPNAPNSLGLTGSFLVNVRDHIFIRHE